MSIGLGRSILVIRLFMFLRMEFDLKLIQMKPIFALLLIWNCLKGRSGFFFRGIYLVRLLGNNPFLSLEDLKKKETLNRYSTRLNRAGFRVVITYHCLQLKSCSKRRKYREYSPELIKEIRKFRHFTEMQSFCRKYRLDTPEQVENLKAYPNLIYFPVLS